MRLPVIQGTIKRRILVNYRADPEVIQKILPSPFRPKLHAGHALVGICLIRLENIRPAGLPAAIGLSSENAAHRIAVEWTDEHGAVREGVFIPRRDSNSRLNQLAGGRIFPGEHHAADFIVSDNGTHTELSLQSSDGSVSVKVAGETQDTWPATSIFTSLAESSAFFEGGRLGYSATKDGSRMDGLLLRTEGWHVRPFHVTSVASGYFANEAVFPAGSVTFDHALIMRDLAHEWHQAEDMS